MLIVSAILQLLKPLAYLRIRHPTKVVFDFWLPIFFAASIWLFFFYVIKSPRLFGGNGFITGINGLLQVLVGFYIAGLAAIATFQNPGMDDKLSGTPVTLSESYRGQSSKVELTRRRFLCYLFGYLSWISLSLYLVSVIVMVSSGKISELLLHEYFYALKFGFLFIYLFVLSNLFVTTMLGLYYMSYRIHVFEPRDSTERHRH